LTILNDKLLFLRVLFTFLLFFKTIFMPVSDILHDLLGHLFLVSFIIFASSTYFQLSSVDCNSLSAMKSYAEPVSVEATTAIKMAQTGDTGKGRATPIIYRYLLKYFIHISFYLLCTYILANLQALIATQGQDFLNLTRDWTGDTLLAVAVWHEQYETAKMLLESGAKINSVNDNNSSPLHRASYRNNIELAILLMNHGADYSVWDKTGRRPADVGDRVIRKVIKELQRVSDEETNRLEEIEREKAEELRYETIAKRQRNATTVIVAGAKHNKANGTFEPVDEVSCDWPVYSKRGDRDVWLLYMTSKRESIKNNGTVFEFPADYSKWVIQSSKDKGGERAYVEFHTCDPPTYPELRPEGSNGNKK
jgi:hypothetical protein